MYILPDIRWPMADDRWKGWEMADDHQSMLDQQEIIGDERINKISKDAKKKSNRRRAKKETKCDNET